MCMRPVLFAYLFLDWYSTSNCVLNIVVGACIVTEDPSSTYACASFNGLFGFEIKELYICILFSYRLCYSHRTRD